MRINIETIPHEQQRYNTCGDYFYDDLGTLQVRISEQGNEFFNKLIMVHELIEEALTKQRGLTEHEIMDFDLYFEKRRDLGLVDKDAQAGFDKNAPYLKEHTISDAVERLMCASAGISYDEYLNNE